MNRGGTGGNGVNRPDPVEVERRAFLYWRMDLASTGLPDTAFPEWANTELWTRQHYRKRAESALAGGAEAEEDDGA
jgi:hypothetical protein